MSPQDRPKGENRSAQHEGASMTDLLAVHTSVSHTADATRLSEEALHRGLAACVQLTMIESRYIWKNALVHESEIDLMFKTTVAHYDALSALIRSLHPYELPSLYALPVSHADAEYAAWVARQADGSLRPLITTAPGGEGGGGGMAGG
ncbi:MAG: divalent-cation tolerance protein CutA [Aquabacterium sp.]